MRNFSKEEIQEIAQHWLANRIVYVHKTIPVIYPIPILVAERLQPGVKQVEQYCLDHLSEFLVLECEWEIYRDAFDLFASNWLSQVPEEFVQAWELSDLSELNEIVDEAADEHGFAEPWRKSKMHTFTDFINAILRPYNTAHLQMQ